MKKNTRLLLAAIEAGDHDKVVPLAKTVQDIDEEMVHPVTGLLVTPLTLAAWSNRLKIMEELLKAGADIDRGPMGWTALMVACDCQRLNMVAFLLDACASTNARSKGPKAQRGWTALMVAAMRGNLVIAKRLLAAGADAGIETPLGQSAVNEAARAGKFELVKLLVDAGCPIRGRAVLGCVMAGSLETVTYLLKAGCDPNFVEQGRESAALKGYTPLGAAVINGRTAIAKELIKSGADPNMSFLGRLPPLCSAAFQGNVTLVRALLKAGADIESLNPAGRTPLGCAVEIGDLKMIRVLLLAGANRNGRGRIRNNRHGQSPIELARCKGNPEILRVLQR